MGRRKKLFYGLGLDEKFRIALGFPEHERASDILSEIDYETPKIDWGKMANMIAQEVPQYAKSEIDFLFETELDFRVRRAIASDLSGEVTDDQMSESEFLKNPTGSRALRKD